MRVLFTSEKGILSWLRCSLGYEVKANIIASEEWATPRVLLVTEGNSVSIYVDGNVIMKHIDRPVCETIVGNDLVDEALQQHIGSFWAEVYRETKHHLTFWTDSRPIRARVITGLPRIETR